MTGRRLDGRTDATARGEPIAPVGAKRRTYLDYGFATAPGHKVGHAGRNPTRRCWHRKPKAAPSNPAASQASARNARYRCDAGPGGAVGASSAASLVLGLDTGRAGSLKTARPPTLNVA